MSARRHQPTTMTGIALLLPITLSTMAIVLLAPNLPRLLAEFAAVPHATLDSQSLPSVTAALRLATQREAVAFVEPLYLREADAVANFSTRERS